LLLSSAVAARVLRFFPPRRSSDLLGARGDRSRWRFGLLRALLLLLLARHRDLGDLGHTRCEIAAVVNEDARAAVAEDHLDLVVRSEEHTSELQSRENLVCRLLL